MSVRFDPQQPDTFAAHLARIMGRCRHGEDSPQDCLDCQSEATQDRRDWGQDQ
jgi:hypothetical protein